MFNEKLHASGIKNTRTWVNMDEFGLKNNFFEDKLSKKNYLKCNRPSCINFFVKYLTAKMFVLEVTNP